ncbi:hypothetical protein EVAR_83562_1 [Eumeta japonica]|uniref:Uncharacterized protein n=1 Tax=Eumeta variegata TaxID=151549 RepID=A0A4C1UNA8_EUMVA|nr:hypothetical protein EVAR_83562_1 [Eumeta japonica]
MPPPDKITSLGVPFVRQDGDAPLCRKGLSGDSGGALGGTIHSTPTIVYTWDSITPCAGGTPGARVSDGPGATVTGGLFSIPGGDGQSDRLITKTKGSET